MTEHAFQSFAKMPRLFRDMVITEKIDGTNAQIFIADDFETIKVGSRTRWITPEDDNFGFAKWVEANKIELLKLGPGRHFGEWWGSGIQRNYGLKEKRFSLFNVAIWGDDAVRPACCSVTPTLYSGPMSTDTIQDVMKQLKETGSKASPGFMDPEGVIVYHKAAGTCFKVTYDDRHKESV